MYPIHVAMVFDRMKSYGSVNFFLLQTPSERIMTTRIMVQNGLHLK